MSAQAPSPKQLLKHCPLFAGFSSKELDCLLPVMKPELCAYRKGRRIFACGDRVRPGILTKGEIYFKREPEGLPPHTVEIIKPDHLFGLDIMFSGVGSSPMDLIAESDCSVLFFDLHALLEQIQPETRVHLLDNASQMLANRCIRLLYRTEVLSIRLLRDQLMTFFRIMQQKQGSDTISPRMNQRQLASYLCVNRSALSRELNRMQRDGLIHLKGDGKITILRSAPEQAAPPHSSS